MPICPSPRWRSGATVLVGCVAVTTAVLGGANAVSAAPARHHHHHHHATASSRHAAPNPHRFDVIGSVAAVSDSSITVTDARGASRTYAITDATSVRDGDATTTTIDTVAAGYRVVVQATKGSTASALVAKSVNVLYAQSSGTITAVDTDNGTFTVADRSGAAHTVVVSDATTYKLDGASSTSDALVVGRVACARGQYETDGTTLDAVRVDVVTSAARGHGPRH